MKMKIQEAQRWEYVWHYFFSLEKFNYFSRLRTLKGQQDCPIHVIQYKHTQERNSSMVVRKTDIKRGVN